MSETYGLQKFINDCKKKEEQETARLKEDEALKKKEGERAREKQWRKLTENAVRKIEEANKFTVEMLKKDTNERSNDPADYVGSPVLDSDYENLTEYNKKVNKAIIEREKELDLIAQSKKEEEATKCRAKIEELVEIYDSIKKETVDITKDGKNIYEMFQLIIEIYDSRTFDNLKTPGNKSVCSKTQLNEDEGKLSPIIKLLKTIELFQDEKYVTYDNLNFYKVIIKNSLQTKGMDKKIVFNVELKDIITEKIETIRLLDLKFDTKTYKEVSEGIITTALELVRTQKLSKEEAAVKIQSIIQGRQQAQKKLIRKKRMKELENELGKKQKSNTDIIIYGKGEKSEEYKQKEIEKEKLIIEIEKICNFIIENIKYHPGNKKEMFEQCNKEALNEELKKIMKENHGDLDENEIEYLEKEIEFLKEALKTFSNGEKLIIQNKERQNLLAELKKNNPNKKKITSSLLSQQLRQSTTNPSPPTTLQIEDLNQEHDRKKEELQKKLLEYVKNDDKEKLEQIYKNELQTLTEQHRLELEKINKEAKEREKKLEQKLKKAENSKQDEETTKEEIERLTKLIVQNNLIQKKIEQENKKLKDSMSETQKILQIEMRKKEEEKRKRMKKFLEDIGGELETAIESLKDEKKNFTNMSELKIAALESYPILHDKIKKFLVFKEDELIKAHHAKFYSDNIKRNNEKLVETLKLVPSEPFLGIEGLPLVAGFGSTAEKEEEINLKVVKEGVRKFIQDRAEHIFNPSQHEQLSVKEYLKTL